MLFFWTFYSSNNPENKQYIMVASEIWISTTVFNIDNNYKSFSSSKSVYYNDFWGSCDTKDWNNDAENSALNHRNKLHFTIYSNKKQVILHCNNIKIVLLYFKSNNASFVSIRDFFQKQTFCGSVQLHAYQDNSKTNILQ